MTIIQSIDMLNALIGLTMRPIITHQANTNTTLNTRYYLNFGGPPEPPKLN